MIAVEICLQGFCLEKPPVRLQSKDPEAGPFPHAVSKWDCPHQGTETPSQTQHTDLTSLNNENVEFTRAHISN